MDRGLVPPCLELGDEPEHRLLDWAGRRAGKDGLIRLGQDKLLYRAEQDARVGAESFQHLEDAGYIEKISAGDSYRYRVLVFCPCKGGNPPSSSPALRREYMLPHNEPGLEVGEDASWLVTSNGVKSESVQKSATTVSLAKYFFPEVVRAAGIQMTPLQTNGPALASHLNRWKLQGVDLETMKLMMEEFARHPEWCRRSRKTPWQVFVGRRGELASLLAYRMRKDPANRRWSNGRDWFSLTPRVNSAV
jgi:hypothetical protein